MDLPSSSGASMRWVPHDTRMGATKVLEQTDSMVSVELGGGRQQTLALEDAPRVVMSTISRTYSDLSDMEDFSGIYTVSDPQALSTTSSTPLAPLSSQSIPTSCSLIYRICPRRIPQSSRLRTLGD